MPEERYKLVMATELRYKLVVLSNIMNLGNLVTTVETVVENEKSVEKISIVVMIA